MSEYDDMMAQLKQRRDELRLQMHLASKEMRDEWKELEEKMESFSQEAKLSETGAGVSHAMGQLGQELKQGYERIWKAMTNS